MKYTYWITLSLVVFLGVSASIYMGSKSPNIPLIEYTQVEAPEELGSLIFQGLEVQLSQSPVLFLGVMPNMIEDIEVLKGFFEAVQKKSRKFDIVGVEQNLPYVELLESNLRFDGKEEVDRLFNGIIEAQKQKLRIAVVLPTIYATQILKSNLASKLKERGLKFTSISIAKYPISKEQEESFDPVCAVEVGDIKGTGALGCAIREMATKTYLYKQQANKYSGMMNKIGDTDYLLIFNRNEIFK